MDHKISQQRKCGFVSCHVYEKFDNLIRHSLKKNDNLFTAIGIIIVLVFLFAINPLFSVLLNRLYNLNESNFLLISRFYYWIVLSVIWQYSLRYENESLLIWRSQKHKLWTYLVSFVVIYVILVLVLNGLKSLLTLFNLYNTSEKFKQALDLFRNNHGLIIFTCLTAAVVEELIFRGYLQPRFTKIFKSKWLAILVTSLLFGLLHFRYLTIINIVGPFLIGIVFSAYYLKFRSIKFLIVFHFIWDLLVIYFQIRTYR